MADMLSRKNIESSHSRIAFVETSKDVEEILAGLLGKGVNPFQVGWVPTATQADLALRQKGILPITPTSLLSIDDRKRIYLDAVDWSLHWLDENAVNNAPVFFEREFFLTDLIKHNIYYWFDHLFYLVTLIVRTIAKFQPRVVLLPTNEGFETVKSIDITGEYFLSRIGKKVCKKHNIDLFVFDNRQSTYPAIPKRNRVRSKTRFRNLFFKLLSFWHYRCNIASVHTMEENVRQELGNRRILSISGGGGRWAKFWRVKKLTAYLRKWTTADIVELFNYTVPPNSDEPGIYCNNHLDKVPQSAEYSRLRDVITTFIKGCIDSKMVSGCIYGEVDLNDLCNQKLKWILESYLPSYWINYLTIKEAINRNVIDLAVSASNVEGGTFLIAAIHNFQRQKIPTLLCPHAIAYSLYDDDNEIQRGFNLHYKPLKFSHVAALGEFTKQKLREGGVDESRVRVTGNLEYGARRYTVKLTKWLTRTLIGYPFKKKLYC
ncbi:hypothetical protein MYX75_00050 [Acidobacteria bacterium AH-259-A15]|nr:hypothetical protein [Acidobacteria bacterium AH-259-A15]